MKEKVVSIGVGAIVRRGNEILMLRRKNVHGSGTWSTPGGHIDFGESPEECAIREVKEETGLSVINPRFYAITNDYFAELGKHYITIWIEAEYDGGEPQVTAEYESDKVEWVEPSKIPQTLFEPFRKLLEGETSPTKTLF
jgi:8-oxo-dGTP diphosphatase